MTGVSYRLRPWRRIACTLCLSFLLACEQTPVTQLDEQREAKFLLAEVHDNTNSVLSALVSLKTVNAQSVYVEIIGDSLIESETPRVAALAESTVVPVLGLKTQKEYSFRPVAVSAAGKMVYGPLLTYETKPLPGGIPPFRVVISSSPFISYVLMGLNPARQGKSYAIILDKNGDVRWYRELPGAVFDFQKQCDGVFTASTSAGAGSIFHKIDGAGNVTQVISASAGLETGIHELRMVDASYALFGVEYRTMNLSVLGGLSDARVRGMVVEYHRVGKPPLLWHTFEHFSVTDASADISLATPSVNPWHGNAIDIDPQGNLLVSFRNSDEITKIDSQTDSIVWRMGGKKNQFTFVNDDLNGFSHQHGVRLLPNGNILLFDNGGPRSSQHSRAVEYRVDESSKMAELVWEYRPNPGIFGNLQGSVQRLANGNTLVCFGTAQRIIEVDAAGRKRWELTIEEPGRYAYRAYSVESLY